jgi:hypothetical protein
MFKKVKTIIKKMGIAILIFLAVVLIEGDLNVILSPEFGGSPSEEDQTRYTKTNNYKDVKLNNSLPISMDMGFKSDRIKLLLITHSLPLTFYQH